MEYRTSKIARKAPTWRLPAVGRVAGLLTDGGVEAGVMCAQEHGLEVMWFWAAFWVVVSLGGLEVGSRECASAEQPQLKRLSRVLLGINLAPVSSDFSLGSDEERHPHDHLPVGAPVQDRVGVGWRGLELRRPTPPGLHGVQFAARC